MPNIFMEYDPRAALLCLTLAMLAGWGIGWLMGHRLRIRESDRRGSKFDDASLARLGLLLAFTFGMSLAKHDNRRNMVVDDANSIGDFYNYAGTLREPLRTKLQSLIRHTLLYRACGMRGLGNPGSESATTWTHQGRPATNGVSVFEHLQIACHGLGARSELP